VDAFGRIGVVAGRNDCAPIGYGAEAADRQVDSGLGRIQRLQNDPREQEIEIRQRLKLAGPGEKIYIIDDKKK